MKAFLQLKRSMNRQLVESDANAVTPVQTEIMIRVQRGETRIADIAVAMQASASAVTQHVNNLVQAGFVTKLSSPEDKREYVLSLTAKGATIIDEKMRSMRKRVEQLVANLTDAELDEFIKLSNKIAGI